MSVRALAVVMAVLFAGVPDGRARSVRPAEGTFLNAFDGDPGTRWSDGFPRRSPFTGSPAAYRSETSLWRIDLGQPTDLAKLELRVGPPDRTDRE